VPATPEPVALEPLTLESKLEAKATVLQADERVDQGPVSAPAPAPIEANSRPIEHGNPKPEPRESRVSVHWSGDVVIELQLADSPETVELRQAGDLIEIHFADGKAFHIPFKAVA
jgi:hypothetical protein